MVRAPADWRRILRRAESLVRKRDRRALDLLLPALRWRYLKARNRAVVLLGRLGPIAVQALLTALDDARTAAERGGAGDALGRIGDSRAVSRLLRALEDPAIIVRRTSMVALLRLEAVIAVPRILPLLEEDQSGGGRVIAAGALGELQGPRAGPSALCALAEGRW